MGSVTREVLFVLMRSIPACRVVIIALLLRLGRVGGLLQIF